VTTISLFYPIIVTTNHLKAEKETHFFSGWGLQIPVGSPLQIVTVVGGTVYASTEGNHTPPFASWETAATNLQDAVNAAVWGGTVWVAGGTYRRGGQAAEGFTQTNRVCIEKPITVRGANGASPVVIEGAWHEPGVTAAGSAAVRGVYLGHKQARLIDVTVAGGATGTDEDDGGGIYCADGAAGGSNCVVTACVANDEGGGVWGGSWSGCIFSDNKAGYGGGCSSAILSETCIVGGNTADSYGGGAYRCELTGCTVTGNTCLYGDGGGLYDSPATRCVIRDNVAHDDGGGAYGESVICSLVSGNTAGYAGGVSESSVELCTVVDNTATEYGGGVGWCTVINSIIWGNHAPAETNTAYSDFRYSQTIPLPEGEYDRGGNCDADPLFVDATAGNYRLQAESPCLNTGTNDACSADASSQDLDGQARVIGVSVDRGAYEYATAAGFAARGTPIDWLDGYYAGPDWNAAELDDSDGDGFPAWEEYITATDPTDGASCFVIVSATVSATGGFSLSFDTATGRIYTVQHSVCLTPASWANAAEPITGTGHRQTVVLPDEGNAFFYRVRVALP